MKGIIKFKHAYLAGKKEYPIFCFDLHFILFQVRMSTFSLLHVLLML